MDYGVIFDAARPSEELAALEQLAADPDFWKDQAEAQRVLQRRRRLQEAQALIASLQRRSEDLAVLVEWIEAFSGRVEDGSLSIPRPPPGIAEWPIFGYGYSRKIPWFADCLELVDQLIGIVRGLVELPAQLQYQFISTGTIGTGFNVHVQWQYFAPVFDTRQRCRNLIKILWKVKCRFTGLEMVLVFRNKIDWVFAYRATDNVLDFSMQLTHFVRTKWARNSTIAQNCQ